MSFPLRKGSSLRKGERRSASRAPSGHAHPSRNPQRSLSPAPTGGGEGGGRKGERRGARRPDPAGKEEVAALLRLRAAVPISSCLVGGSASSSPPLGPPRELVRESRPPRARRRQSFSPRRRWRSKGTRGGDLLHPSPSSSLPPPSRPPSWPVVPVTLPAGAPSSLTAVEVDAGCRHGLASRRPPLSRPAAPAPPLVASSSSSEGRGRRGEEGGGGRGGGGGEVGMGDGGPAGRLGWGRPREPPRMRAGGGLLQNAATVGATAGAATVRSRSSF
jgi:hypothetical protein